MPPLEEAAAVGDVAGWLNEAPMIAEEQLPADPDVTGFFFFLDSTAIGNVRI